MKNKYPKDFLKLAKSITNKRAKIVIDHITLEKIRRLELTWQGAEVSFFEALKKEAEKGEIDLPDYVKALLIKHLNKGN